MQHIHSQPSLARLIRQILFAPYLHNRWLNKDTKAHFANCITEAERGHTGEIYLIIENHLPISHAYHEACRERALALFASHRVWDTEDNTGVLIYINLCEHDVEIIADRGIDTKVMAQGLNEADTGKADTTDTWQILLQSSLTAFKNNEPTTAITDLIAAIGDVLRLHFPSADIHGNELPNQPVYLR